MKKSYIYSLAIIGILLILGVIAFSATNMNDESKDKKNEKTSQMDDKKKDSSDKKMDESKDMNTDSDMMSTEMMMVDMSSMEQMEPEAREAVAAETTVDYSTYPRQASLPTVATTLQGYDYSQSSGMAYFDPATEGVNLYVEFMNLPDIKDSFFYEGWLVNTNAGTFISTGEAVKNDDGIFVDTYSGTNLEQYNRYVLTLEPRDNDPAPAEHVVENNFSSI